MTLTQLWDTNRFNRDAVIFTQSAVFWMAGQTDIDHSLSQLSVQEVWSVCWTYRDLMKLGRTPYSKCVNSYPNTE